jgi:membrane peptidoglycan carboxypeptidase
MNFKTRLINNIILKKQHLTQKKGAQGWPMKAVLTIFAFLIVGFLAFAIYVVVIIGTLPALPTRFDNAESTIIYDREGNILYSIHGEENRQEIPLDEIPKHVIDATIAIEDDQFFNHYGFDIGGILRGFSSEYLGIGKRRGGSTITQQLVKNTLLSSERTLSRKIKELIIALKIEQTYNKNEILGLYLNTIPYGSNTYGIEMAARTFFGKNAKDLTLAEAAILASLPQAPSRYNPYGNGKEELMGTFDAEGNYIPGRKDVVLKRMEDLGYITPEERQKAFEEAAQLSFKKFRENITHPHFVLYVKELLENKFGKEAVETGGLHVYTTIDPNLQKKAEEVISEKMKTYPGKYGATNAALLTVDAVKGQILAMVGSADYFNEEIDGNVNVVFRKRLPGSSFKPIVYAAGFAKGYSPATVLWDLETDFGNNYIPQNYDGRFRGPISARRALDNSLNIPAVQMAFIAGIENVVALGKKMGLTDLTSADDYGSSIALGTGEVTLYQMVTAYTVFAREGKKIAFTPFLRIETSAGKIIESYEDLSPKSLDVLDPQIAYSINHVLSDKNARPPAWNANLQLPDQINGAKTGTSNKRILEKGHNDKAIKPVDNWTMGFTTKIVTGVWVGNNDSSPLFPNSDGLTTAAPIWNAVMREATKDHDAEPFPVPEGVVWKQVSKWSGLLPSEYTPESDVIPELFTTFNLPTLTDQTFLEVEVDRASLKLPTEFTPKSSIVKALVANFHSLNPTNPNWESPVLAWAKDYIANSITANQIILSQVPTESDDVHTAEAAENGPKLSFLSPKTNDQVQTGNIDVLVDIDAPHGVEKVEYFLDQRLVKTSKIFPFGEKIRLPKRAQGEEFRIGATVTDSYGYESSDVIVVTVSNGTDLEPPETRITSPEEGASFPPRTTITVQTSTRDNMSITEAEFFLDDRSVGKVRKPPYSLNINLPEEIASHTIRVTTEDNSGNVSQDSVTIRIEENVTEAVTATGFSFPKPDSILKKGSPIDFFFSLSDDDKKLSNDISIIAKNLTALTKASIYSRSTVDNPSQNFSFSWVPQREGEYEFTIVITATDATEKIVGSLKVKVE